MRHIADSIPLVEKRVGLGLNGSCLPRSGALNRLHHVPRVQTVKPVKQVTALHDRARGARSIFDRGIAGDTVGIDSTTNVNVICRFHSYRAVVVH